MQKALHTCPDHDLFRRTDHSPHLVKIRTEHFPELLLSLRFTIGQKSCILTKSALHITSPEFKPETLPVHVRGHEVVLYFLLLPVFLHLTDFRRLFLLHRNIRDIIPALRFGKNVSLGCKKQIGALHRRAADLKLDRTLSDRRKLRIRRQLSAQDQFFIIMIHAQIPRNILVFQCCRHLCHLPCFYQKYI